MTIAERIVITLGWIVTGFMVASMVLAVVGRLDLAVYFILLAMFFKMKGFAA